MDQTRLYHGDVAVVYAIFTSGRELFVYLITNLGECCLHSLVVLVALVCDEIWLGGVCFSICAIKQTRVLSGNCFECLNEFFAHTYCL